MKLYLHLALLVILCASIIDVRSMESDGIRALTRNQKREIIRQKNYAEYKQELESRLKGTLDPEKLNAVYRPNLKLDGLSSCFPGVPQEPFSDLLVRYNYPDLLGRLLDKMPVEKHSDVYDSLLRLSVLSNKIETTKVLIDRKVNVNSIKLDDNMGATPLIMLINIFMCQNINNLPLLKLLLVYGANPNIAPDAPDGDTPLTILAKSTKDKNQELLKNFIQLLIVSGADCEARIVAPPYDDLEALNALEYAQVYGNDNLKMLMIVFNQPRTTLLKDVTNGNGISFTDVSGFSRRHVKDSEGNNLLFHALFNNNKSVALKLLALWPQMLFEPNFEGRYMLYNDQVRANFFELIGWTNFIDGLQDYITELRAANKESL